MSCRPTSIIYFLLVLSPNGLDLQVRREKISERMKILERLVPGCDKVQFSSFVFLRKNNAIPSLHLGVIDISDSFHVVMNENR